MDLLQLKYFVCVAEQGSFSNAGLQLDVAQPTLSRRVRALELELKTHLFYRHGRGAHLTPEGRRFLDHARGVLHGADAALRSVHEGTASYSGKVAVGLPPSVGRLIIPSLMMDFSGKFPKGSLSLIEGLSHDLYDKMLTGRLDFAVLRNPPASPHLSIELIRTESFYLIGAKPVGDGKRSVTLADLVGLRFIMPTSPHAFRPLLESAMARLNSTLNVIHEVDAVASLMDLAAAGVGYNLIPDSSIKIASKSPGLYLQKIDAPELYTTLCLVTPASRPKTRLLEEAVDLAREVLLRELQLD